MKKSIIIIVVTLLFMFPIVVFAQENLPTVAIKQYVDFKSAKDAKEKLETAKAEQEKSNIWIQTSIPREVQAAPEEKK